MEQESQRSLSDPAIIVLDSRFRPLGYNAEAVRVLIYPRNPKSINLVKEHLETKLRWLLGPPHLSRRTRPKLRFQSGRRQYGVRLFSLNNSRTGSYAADDPSPGYTLLLERLDSRFVDLSAAATRYRLTRREQETLQFLAQGMTSKEIANAMGISPNTVKAFVRLVMSKMQVSTRSGIVGRIVMLRPLSLPSF